jgi:hypothetical protein
MVLQTVDDNNATDIAGHSVGCRCLPLRPPYLPNVLVRSVGQCHDGSCFLVEVDASRRFEKPKERTTAPACFTFVEIFLSTKYTFDTSFPLSCLFPFQIGLADQMHLRFVGNSAPIHLVEQVRHPRRGERALLWIFPFHSLSSCARHPLSMRVTSLCWVAG